MNKILTLIILVSISLSSVANELNMKPKMLKKELAKYWAIGSEQLSETNEFQSEFMGNGQFYKAIVNDSLIGYVYVGRVISCRTGGCSNETDESTADNSEYFDVFMLISVNKTVNSVRVFNYQATHGQEICGKGWLNQFKKSPKNKNYEVGNNIDSISGATISVYALTHEVNKVLAVL